MASTLRAKKIVVTQHTLKKPASKEDARQAQLDNTRVIIDDIKRCIRELNDVVMNLRQQLRNSDLSTYLNQDLEEQLRQEMEEIKNKKRMVH